MAMHQEDVPHSDRLNARYSAAADDGKKSAKQREAAMLYSVGEEQLDGDRVNEAIESARQAVALFKQEGDVAAATDSTRLLLKAQLIKADNMKWNDEDSQAAKDLIKKTETTAKEEVAMARQQGQKRKQAAMLLSLAEMNYNRRGQKKREDALQAALEAAPLFKQLGDTKLEATTHLALARIYFKTRDSKSSLASAKEAVRLYQAVADVTGEGEATHCVASASAQAYRLPDALEASQKAAALFKQSGAKKMYARECHALATWYLDKGDVAKAFAASKDCFAILKELKYGKGWESSALSLMVECMINLGKVHMALRETKNTVKEFVARGDTKEHVRTLQVMVSALAADNDPTEAARVVDEGVDIAQSISDKYLEIEMRKCGVELYMNQEKFDAAVEQAESVKELYKDLGHTKEEANTLMYSVMKAHMAANSKQQAMNSADEALKLVEALGNKSLEASALLTNAAAFYMNDEANKALKCAQEAADLFNEDGDKKGEAKAHLMCAQVHRQTEQYKAAMVAAADCLQIQEEMGDQKSQASTMMEMAEIHIDNHKYKDGIAVLHDAVKLAKFQEDASLLSKLLTKMAFGYARMLEKEDPGSRLVKDVIEKALKSAKEGIKMASQVCDMALEASGQYYLASLYLSAGKTSDLMQAAQEAIALYKQTGNSAGQVRSMCLIGKSFMASAKPAKAKALLDDAVALAKKAGNEVVEKEASDLLKELDAMRSQNVVMMAPGAAVPAAAPAAGAASAAPAAAGPSAVKAYVPPSVDIIKERVKHIVGDVTGEGDPPDEDTPFMDAGIDSLSSVELRTSLQKSFGVQLPSTVMFNFPTTNAVAGFLLDEMVENEISM